MIRISAQALDNKVFSAAIHGKLKENTNLTEKPKRMGVPMRTRPINFFVTLALLFGVMSIERSWAEPLAAAGYPGDGRSNDAGLTDSGARRLDPAPQTAPAVAGPAYVDTSEDMVDVMGVAAGVFQNVTGANRPPVVRGESEAIESLPPAGGSGALIVAATEGAAKPSASDSCGLAGSPLSPELTELAALTCTNSASDSAAYCSCLERYFSSLPELRSRVPRAAQALAQVGYQLQLEEWIDVFGGDTLAFASFKQRSRGSEVLGDMPPACQPMEIFTHLRNSLSASTCQGDKDAFRRALNNVLQVPDADILNTATPAMLSNLVKLTEERDRFHRRPNAGPNHDEPRDFRDCMEPSEKRAYALLPIPIPVDGARKPAEMAARAAQRLDRLKKISTELSELESNPNVIHTMSYQGTLQNLRPLFAVFPGMEELLDKDSKLSNADAHNMLKELKAFVDDLDHSAYQSLTDPQTARVAMERMKSKVLKVKESVSRKLIQVNSTHSLVDQLAIRCESLKNELVSLACSPPRFVSNTDFMQLALRDAQRRRTARTQGLAITDCRPGSGSPRRGSIPERTLERCLVTRRAQCVSEAQHGAPESVAQHSHTGTEPIVDSTHALFHNEVGDYIESYGDLEEIRRSEEGVVHLMCGDYNKYLHDVACKDSENFGFCAASQTMEGFWASPYATSGFSIAQRDTTFADTPIRAEVLSYRSGGSGGSVTEDFLAGLAGTPTGAEGAAPVVNTNNFGEGLRGAISAVNRQLVQTAPTNFTSGPIEIDAPTSTTVTAGSDVREIQRAIVSQDAEIAAVDAQIAGLGSSPEADATRRELEALRAEMKAVRDELLATRTAAENRTNGSEGSARRDSEVEEDGERRVVGAPARGGITRGPASEGFNIGGSANRAASDAVGSNEFRQASVDSTFGSTAATRGAVIRDAQGLPAVQSNDPNNRIALRVGDASYAVKDVETVVVPAGTPANDQTISALILEAKDRIVLDAEKRAMVEIWDDNSKSSRVVYVRINGLQVEFLELNEETVMPQVRSTLADLQSRLSAGRGAASEGN